MVSSARRPLVAVAAALMVAATGCSGPAQPTTAPGVATLQSAAPSAAAPSVPATAGPVRERIDDTPEDYERLLQPYTKCMERLGLSVKGMRQGTTKMPSKAVQDAAHKECDGLMPLPPWEKDPANPESADFFRDVVKCLKNKGVEYVEVSDGGYALGGPQNDQRSITRGMDLAPECERQVAAKMKK
jgi:hypothetical protein